MGSEQIHPDGYRLGHALQPTLRSGSKGIKLIPPLGYAFKRGDRTDLNYQSD